MMRLSLFIALGAAFFLGLTACQPPESAQSETSKQAVSLNYNDKRIQRLYDFRDRRALDSLHAYLKNPDATLRYLAALSFASARDSNSVDELAALLRIEKNEDVRIAAAFALGQIGHRSAETALIEAFNAADSLSKHQRFNAVVLEAVGKCGSAASLKNIAAVSTYQPSDTLLLEGQCRAIYRFGQRNITDPSATTRMIACCAEEHVPAPARLMAAHYLARTKDLAPDSTQAVQMAVAFVRATDHPEIRMALAKALGKSKTQPAFGILSKVIATESDWRVKCNIVSAMAGFEYDTVRALVIPLVYDNNPHVSRTAAEFFVSNGQAKDGDYYWRIARDNPNLPGLTQIALYRASNKWLSGKNEPESKDFVNFRLRDMFLKTQEPYEKAACLNALAEFGWQYRWIHDNGFTNNSPVVKSTAAEALLSILQKPNFYAFFGENSRSVRRELYYYLREIVGSGDPGMIAAAADGFRVEALDFKSLRDSSRVEDFRTALGKLTMPRDVEAYQALEKTIAWFEGQPLPKYSTPAWNHPIDWEELKLIGDKTRAVIETEKGNITLVLYPQWAPGSVVNFVKLATSGKYDNKTFHRVVPNFVIQGGCPRGDGYGAENYSIRSEHGLLWYDGPGYVGMASAGPDTEGTQFFITHSATPHLDGNYSIFAKVESGQDVADRIQPGDQIKRVTIVYK
ncbi:MAG: peptidylprolyl isomerase [Chitinophagales bacterium]|nr:peptidylprolyl isomerase [Chitinophagales bacterium]